MKIKNPFSVLLGTTLQALRKEHNCRIEDIADALSITPSAYRMIESGNANLNTNKTLTLMSISCFERLKFEKLAKFLISMHILEPLREDQELCASNIRTLCLVDKEFFFIFENVDILEILKEPAKLEAFYNSKYTFDATLQFLSGAVNMDAERLKNDLRIVKQGILCIFQPTLKLTFEQYERTINELSRISKLESQLSLMKYEFAAIRSTNLGYTYHNSTNWRSNRIFKSHMGLLHHSKFLADADIQKRFLDNFKQLWSSHFENLTYIIVSDDFQEIKKNISAHKRILRDIYNGLGFDTKEVSFDLGYSKVRYETISPNHDVLVSLGLENNLMEMWIYIDEDNFKYAFKTKFVYPDRNVTDVVKSKPEDQIPEFIILTVQETEEAYDELNNFINN